MALTSRRMSGKPKIITSDAAPIKVTMGKSIIEVYERNADDERHLMAKMLLWRLQVAKTGRVRSVKPTDAELGVALAKIDTWMLIRGWDTEDGLYEAYQLDLCFDDIEEGELHANQRSVTATTH